MAPWMHLAPATIGTSGGWHTDADTHLHRKYLDVRTRCAALRVLEATNSSNMQVRRDSSWRNVCAQLAEDWPSHSDAEGFSRGSCCAYGSKKVGKIASTSPSAHWKGAQVRMVHSGAQERSQHVATQPRMGQLSSCCSQLGASLSSCPFVVLSQLVVRCVQLHLPCTSQTSTFGARSTARVRSVVALQQSPRCLESAH